jgi:phosphohistidine swiveling domain-containing protein
MKTPVAAPQARTPELVPLSEAAGRPGEVGVKAANLGVAMAAGFPVPDGVVLTADALGHALSALQDDTRVPPSLERSIGEVLERLGPGPVAVRSSGIAEDLAGASYAGQYETVLGVEGLGPVAAAVRRCWASGSAARVAAYDRGRSEGQPRMAVLIQRLVPADAAGVAFTANPVSGARDETLVSAVRGLGDRLVSGEVTPDEWIVRGDRAQRRGERAEAIDAQTARSIAQLARQLEALFGAPQDVEWALAGEALFVLQARPITALPIPADAAEPVPVPVEVPEGFWEREASHFPLPLSPMTRSVEIATQNDAMVRVFAELGILADGLEFREIGGWVYTRAVPLGGKDRPVPPAPLMWLLLRVVPQLRSRVSVAKRALREDLFGQIIRSWHDEARPGLQRRIEALRDVRLETLDDRALLEHWADVRSLLDDGMREHFRLVPPIALARFELARACRELLGWDEPRAFELLSGLSAMSTSPALALSDLSRLAATRPRVRELVDRADREAVSLLPREDPEFEAAFRQYQHEFATRARRYEVADPTLAETPELTLATLRDQLRRGYDGRSQAAALAARRSAVLAEARGLHATRDEADRARFERALERAEVAHPVHEENEFFTLSVPLALARYVVLETGRRLASRGVITDPEDVFFLEIDEALAAFANGSDQHELVARRKGERAWVVAHPGPATYGQQPALPPLRVLPAESRIGLEAMLWAVDRIFAAARSSQRQSSGASTVTGIAASPGRYTGTVRVVAGEHEFEKIQAGDVLVCPVTSPVWSVLFCRIGALVTDSGGILSHPAIIAREYGVPAVVATGNATALLRDGQQVTVDGDAGLVQLQAG